MALGPGARLGPYEIQSLLGAGGMGEVYRARDPRLGRDVAVKVLPADLSLDPNRLHRFEQEARAAAALNHPNIVAVHDIGTHDGSPYIVAELLDGETLRMRLETGALFVRKAIDYGVQIARGLGAAHDRGIVHRDLKPENVFVTADGRVKILDFGLAKLVGPALAGPHVRESEGADAHGGVGAGFSRLGTTLPTAGPDTLPGTVLGTVGYMAPEQVRGAAADHRADIFALGAILYEMIAGTRAFRGDSAAETMSAILKEDPPDLAQAARRIAPALTRIVNRCLEKDPAARFRSVDDLAFALEALSDAASITDVARPVRPWEKRRLLAWAIAIAVVLISAATFFAMRLASPGAESADPRVSRVELNLPADTELYIQAASSVALSPDGTAVAFLGTIGGIRQVYLRRLDQFRTVALQGSDYAQTCLFSADGRSVGFIGVDGVLKKASLADGLVAPLTRGADFHMGAAWTADDRIIFGRNGTLWQIPAAGGTPTQITMLDSAKRELMHGWPSATDGAGAILFASVTGSSSASTHIEALLPSGERRVLVESGTYPIYAPSGHLIFFRDGALLAAPFDAERVTVTGPPVRVVENFAVAAVTGMPIVAISRAGSLVYPSNTATSRIVWVRRDGAEQPLNAVTRLYRSPRLASDQRTLVVEAGGHLWMQDIARGTFTRLTSANTEGNSFPVLTHDASRVIYRTLTGMQWIATDGSGQPQRIPGSSTVTDIPSSVSHDNRTLAFLRQTTETSGDVYVVSLDDSAAPRAVVSTAAYRGRTAVLAGWPLDGLHVG